MQMIEKIAGWRRALRAPGTKAFIKQYHKVMYGPRTLERSTRSVSGAISKSTGQSEVMIKRHIEGVRKIVEKKRGLKPEPEKARAIRKLKVKRRKSK